jgi:hypothetical protein
MYGSTFVPSNLEDSLFEAGLAEGRDNVNVYFSWHVLRPDLAARVRGGTEDVIAKLALVADFDYGPSHTEGNNFDPETGTIPGLSIAPSALIETAIIRRSLCLMRQCRRRMPRRSPKCSGRSRNATRQQIG